MKDLLLPFIKLVDTPTIKNGKGSIHLDTGIMIHPCNHLDREKENHPIEWIQGEKALEASASILLETSREIFINHADKFHHIERSLHIHILNISMREEGDYTEKERISERSIKDIFSQIRIFNFFIVRLD